MRDARWNHNIHYWPLVLRAAPARCERALDVGCGEGRLTRELVARGVAREVVGIDRDAPSIASARLLGAPDDGVSFVVGDFMTSAFAPGSFDLVVCVAALHHMDTARALARMGALVRPGGTVAVVGLARGRRVADLPRDVAAVVVDRGWKVRRPYWESSAPVIWPPAETYGQVRATARRMLPGSRFRRRLLWRYSLTWTRPG